MTALLVTGTLDELRAIRAHWRTLAPAAAALEALGFADRAAGVADICNALGSARFAVPVPCMFCGTSTATAVVIGDPHKAEPATAICGRCGAEIGAEADSETGGGLAGPASLAGRPDPTRQQLPADASKSPAARPAGAQGHICLCCGCQIAEGLAEVAVPGRGKRVRYRHADSSDCADALRVPQPNRARIGTYQAHPAFRWGPDRQGPQLPRRIHT